MITKPYLVLAHTTHITAVCVWIGVMLFNLIVGFPMLRARSGSITEYTHWLAEQGTRAAPWLYLLIALTFISGWILYFGAPRLADEPGDNGLLSYFLISNVLLLAMLGCHLYSTIRVWPRIFYATERELGPLITQYRISILASASLGLATIALASTRLVS